MPALPPVASLILTAVSLSTPAVPAQGRAQALVTLDKPAMVRIAASSASGTACDLIDRVIGPFAQSGQAGKTNCQLDLLLDQGDYQLRLESAKRSKGTVRLSATEFSELNPVPQRLQPKALQRFTLKSGQQASFWLTLNASGNPQLRISGRTAGKVALWRNGEWVEPTVSEQHPFSPEPGRPIYEWWFNGPLEKGDYLVRIYGTGEYVWPGGNENDAVEVELGFREGPLTRALPFTLGPSGVQVVGIPRGAWATLLTLDTTPTAPVELSADGNTCVLQKKALVAQCTAWVDTTASVHVVTVRGPAGTKGVVEWAPRGGAGWYGGYYGSAAANMGFRTRSSIGLVGLHDLPIDTDAAPLGCMLVDGERRIATDFPRLGAGRSLDVKFNYDGSGAIIWFDVERAGRYRIETKGGRKSRCELFRFPDGSADLERISQSQPDAKSCAVTLMLNPGSHQLSLYEGLPGIEQLVIREDGKTDAKPIPVKAGCLLTGVPLAYGDHVLHTSRFGALAARGLVAAELPLTLDGPLHLTLDPGRKISLPFAGSTTAIAQSSAGGAIAVGPEKLELDNPTDQPLHFTVYTPAQLPPPPPLEPYAPKLVPLPIAKADEPVFLDFQRGESHSMVFSVEKAGLYNVSTQGLLATRCALRTPVIADVASNASGGRGRNCLVSGYLRPGRYMLTATTTGVSRGRGSVLLTQRAARQQAQVTAGADTFFRADPGDLVQQKLVVPASGTYELATTAQGADAALLCRLDDAEGWPLTRVPTSCTAPRTLAKGTYLWTELPLTVESMRHTRLARVVPPPVLKGNASHPIDFFTWYQAHLGADGKDEFTFKLEGPAELDIVLTRGMQGRLYLDKSTKAVELVPPTESREAPEPQRQAEGDAEEEPVAAAPDEGYEYEGCGSETCEEPPASAPSAQPLTAADAPPPPSGHRVRLEAGTWRLVTEHSKGDVAIDYQVHLGSTVLMPGMTRSLATPARLPVAVPRDGTLRLRTRGEADVRCRLFDEQGRLVFEGSDNGPDWNCSLAEPVTKGRYVLVLESETQSRSASSLSLQLASVEDQGVATDGKKCDLRAAVQTMAVPPGDALQSLSFSAKTPFSCALEDAAGAVLTRRSRVTTCALLVRPRQEKYRVRLWTTETQASVTLAFSSKPAALAKVAAAGRWKTARGVQCLGAALTGLLVPCGPEVSLEAGEYAFSEAPGLEEVTLAAPAEAKLALSRRPWLEAVTAAGAVTLLEAHVQHGERAAPACGFGAGSVHEGRAYDCYAASAVGPRSVARLWAAVPDDAPIDAATRVRPVTVPGTRKPLTPGRQRLEWSGEAAAYSLPAQASRTTVTLAAQAWAVQLDDAGKAVDLCAPTGALSACALTSRGGGFVLFTGEKEHRADVTLELVDRPEANEVFAGLYEASPSEAGVLELDVPAATFARTLLVEGAQRCVVTLTDGTRLSGCRAELPEGQSAELKVDHGAQALRVVAFTAKGEQAARLGLEVPTVASPTLAASTAVQLHAGRQDRTFVVDRDSVVRVMSSTGVCGLIKGRDLLAVEGFDRGCEVTRVLSAGTYRVMVRPFGATPMAGTIEWTLEPLVALKDGVGGEEWLAPSQSRLYRFTLASKGNVGFGVQASSEALDCAIYDDGHRRLGEGCQQFLALEAGSYLLSVQLPKKAGAAPARFRPVLLGLAGAKADVPQAYLDDFFRRNGGAR